MKVAIIEDEPLAAERLRDLLANYPEERVYVVGQTESVAETIAALPNWDADLLLCDIRLADGLSFNIWEHIAVDTPTIFTTAYEEYALRAFKVNSIDYLLKPIEAAELYSALDKFAARLQRSDQQLSGVPANVIAQVLQAMRQTKYQQRLVAKVGDKLIPLAVQDIAYFHSIDRITWAYGFDGSRHPASETLDQLERVLDPERFARLNRAVIAQDKAIKQLIAYSNSRYKVQLEAHTGEAIIVARDRVADIKAWLAGS